MPSQECETVKEKLDELSREIAKFSPQRTLLPYEADLLSELDLLTIEDPSREMEEPQVSVVVDSSIISEVDEILMDLPFGSDIETTEDSGLCGGFTADDDDHWLEQDLEEKEKEDAAKKDRKDQMTALHGAWGGRQRKNKSISPQRKSELDAEQREIAIKRAGDGREAYNKYKRRQYAAKIKDTEDRAVRSYGAPDDEAKAAKRREQKRLAETTRRAKAKAALSF